MSAVTSAVVQQELESMLTNYTSTAREERIETALAQLIEAMAAHVLQSSQEPEHV